MKYEQKSADCEEIEYSDKRRLISLEFRDKKTWYQQNCVFVERSPFSLFFFCWFRFYHKKRLRYLSQRVQVFIDIQYWMWSGAVQINAHKSRLKTSSTVVTMLFGSGSYFHFEKLPLCNVNSFEFHFGIWFFSFWRFSCNNNGWKISTKRIALLRGLLFTIIDIKQIIIITSIVLSIYVVNLRLSLSQFSQRIYLFT